MQFQIWSYPPNNTLAIFAPSNQIIMTTPYSSYSPLMLIICILHCIRLIVYDIQSPIPIATTNKHHLPILSQYSYRILLNRLGFIEYFKALTCWLLNIYLFHLLQTTRKGNLCRCRKLCCDSITPPLQLITFTILPQTQQSILR